MAIQQAFQTYNESSVIEIKPPVFTRTIDKVIKFTQIFAGIFVLLGIVLVILFDNEIIETSDKTYWLRVSKLILTTAATIIHLVSHPQLIMMTYASFRLLTATEKFTAYTDDKSKPSLSTLEGCHRFLHFHYPWIDFEGKKYSQSDKKIVKFFSSLLGLFCMGILQNFTSLLQYFLAIAVVWPAVPLVSHSLYTPLQSTSLGLEIALRIIEKTLDKQHELYMESQRNSEQITLA